MTERVPEEETLCNENNNEISSWEEINKDVELGGEELLEHENEEKEENIELKDEAGEGEQTVGEDVINGGVKEETNGVSGYHSLQIRGGELDKGCDQETGDKMEEENFKQSEDDCARPDQAMEQKEKNGEVLQSDLYKQRRGEDSSLDTRLVEAENGGIAKICDSMTPDDGKQDETSESTSTGKLTNQKSRPLKSLVRRTHPLRGHSSTKLQRSKVTLASNVSTKSRSSIDIDISRIIRGDAGGEGGDSVTMVTTKSVDFSQPMGTGDIVEQELARAIGNEDATSSFSDFPGGRAAATNTPVDSHLQHRSLHTPVKDNIYEHALHLIKNRCRSRTTTLSSRYPLQYPLGVSEYVWDEDEEDAASNAVSLPTLLSNIDEAPFNCQPNRTFFIMQRHPIPLEPLKVWKGYHGNVFFQPLICRKMRMSVSEKIPVNAVNTLSRKQAYTGRIGLNMDNTRFPHINADAKHRRATTAKTWNGIGKVPSKDVRNVASAAPRPVTRQMSVLDRRTVVSQMDQHFGEDITWLNGIEALGALQIGTGRSRSTAHFYDNRVQHYKLRICRGLVSHNLDRLGKENPTLDVNGDKMKEVGRDTLGVRHGNRQVGGRCQQSVMKLDSGSHLGTLPPQSRQPTSSNGRHVVVDLTKGSEIVREYLVGGRLNMNLVDETNHENVK